MSKLKYIKDFEKLFPKGALGLSQQFRKMISSTTEGENRWQLLVVFCLPGSCWFL